MAETHFKSSLSVEEIEQNFKNTDFFSGIKDGLTEALAYEKGKAGSKQIVYLKNGSAEKVV